MYNFTQQSIDKGITDQLTKDMERMLAGVDIRLDGSAITGGDLQEQIKALLGSGSYYAPESTPITPAPVTKKSSGSKSVAAGNYETTMGGINSSKGGQDTSQKAHGPDVAMPNSLRSLTGAKTVGEFLGNSMTTLALGALTAVNPVAGLVGKGVLSTLKGADPLDTIADIFTGMNPVSAIGKTVLNAVGAYDDAEGLVSSSVDAYESMTNPIHTPTTLAGRNVLNMQVEKERKETGTYDSSRSSQQRASTAAQNRDNAPAYAREGYGKSLADAKNPAASAKTSSDSSKSGNTSKSSGPSALGDSHSYGGAMSGGANKSSSSSSSSSSKGGGGSSSSGGKSGSSSSGSSGGSSSSGNGKSGSGSYGGR